MRIEYQVPSLAGLDDGIDVPYAHDGLRGLNDASASLVLRLGALTMLRPQMTDMATRIKSTPVVSVLAAQSETATRETSKTPFVVMGVAAVVVAALLLSRKKKTA